jgi:xanthine/CO dehydrogenase XdhC/CoxF family maturation factor
VKDIYDIVRQYTSRRGQAFALATLVRVRGSSYRRPGARMLIAGGGRTVGSLSGGCLEEEVAQRGQEILRTGQPSLTSFDTRRRFGCNGAIDIFIERIGDDFIMDIAGRLEARQRCLAETVFEDADEMGSRVVAFESAGHAGALLQEIHPPPRLIIYGDGPDSIPLRALCAVLGWQIVEAEQVSELPHAVDEWTAAIVKSHNYGRDFAALQTLLPLPLRYVGLVGPRRRRDQLLGDVLDSGIPVHADFFAPAGLDLRAETPEEIALAIVTEIQTVFAGSTGKPLRDLKQPIHAVETRTPCL